MKNNNTPQHNMMPPRNLNAEKSVLGSILTGGDRIVDVVDFLSEKHFYDFKNKSVYTAMLGLYENRVAINIITLGEVVKNSNNIEQAYLVKLIEDVPSPAHIDHYAKIVYENAVRRAVIDATHTIQKQAYEGEDFDAFVENTSKGIAEVLGGKTTKRFSPITRQSLIDEVKRRAEQDDTGIQTGFYDLDKKIGRLAGGNIVIVGARTSIGKTSFMLDVASNAADTGSKVAFVSLEMSGAEIRGRLAAKYGDVEYWKIKGGYLKDTTDIEERLQRASENIHIDDTITSNVGEIKRMVRHMKQQEGLDLLVIDYLQLLHGNARDNKNKTTNDAIAEITRELKTLAIELDIPIICASQLSRGGEQQGKPQLYHLRDSGAIEQDADIVLLLHRERHAGGNLDNDTEIVVAKNRHGELGMIKVLFDVLTVSFKNIDTTDRNAPQDKEEDTLKSNMPL